MVRCHSACPHHRSSDFTDLTAKNTTIGIRPSLMAIRSKQVLLKLLREGHKQARLSGPLSPEHESTIDR